MAIKRDNNFINQIADSVKFVGVIENGFCWDALTRERMRDAKSLEPYGYKVYSQNDEDGIIHEIFKRIGTTDKRFIEFGVQDGLESNTHLLLFYGWSGLWIEGSPEYCDQIRMKFRPVIEKGQLKVKNAFITRENINELFSDSGFSGEIDLLSVDIDGNDLYVWDAIDVINPRVVITEYNGKFPPDLEWCQAYNPSHVWSGSDWHGASLKAFERLAEKKGYQLVGTDLRGCNAFFVRKDIAGDLFYEPATAEAMYNPLRLNLEFAANHPARYCLAAQKENLGIFNYLDYELTEGFHAEENGGNVRHAWTSRKESLFKLLVRKGTGLVRIPYCIPEKILEKCDNFVVTVESDRTGSRQFAIKESVGILDVQMEQQIAEDMVVAFRIMVPELWSPAELMHSTDARMLGIDIVFSDIGQCEKRDGI